MQRITTPFGFHSTTEQIVEGIDLSGSAPSSPAARRALASKPPERWRDAETLAVRRPAVGRHVTGEIGGNDGEPDVRVRQLDLNDRRSVRRFVAGWTGPCTCW